MFHIGKPPNQLNAVTATLFRLPIPVFASVWQLSPVGDSKPDILQPADFQS